MLLRGTKRAGEEPVTVTVPREEAPANSVPAAAVDGGGERCSELLGVKRP